MAIDQDGFEGFNFKDASFTPTQYLDELKRYYKLWCFQENSPEACHNLADFYESLRRDYWRAGPIYKMNCEKHDYGPSCFKWGNYILSEKIGLKVDHFQAYRLFEKGCMMSDGDSCFHAGLMRISNLSRIPRDVSRAQELFSRGCQLDTGIACLYMSGMYLEGMGLFERNLEMAFKFALRGCELGNLVACHNVTLMYKRGDGTPVDQEKATQYRRIFYILRKEYEKLNSKPKKPCKY